MTTTISDNPKSYMLVRYPMIFPLHSHNQQNLVQRRLDGVGVLKHPDFPFVPQLLQLSRWPTFLAHEPKLEWGAQLLGSFYNVYGLFLIEHDRTQSSKQSFLALALAQVAAVQPCSAVFSDDLDHIVSLIIFDHVISCQIRR